jgi:hypothetical protein
MAQRLIVEGNDAIVLSALCKTKGVNPPKGYENPDKFKTEFVINGRSYKGALDAFELALEKSDVDNIGLVVDANELGYAARWDAIKHILLKNKISSKDLEGLDQQIGPKILKKQGFPTVGIWIMPDNANIGYLEHFVAKMIKSKDPLLLHVESTLDDLEKQSFNELKANRIGKAKVHTWLAWKNEPGKPFGTAVEIGYFDINAPIANEFVHWFQDVFDLS